MTRLMIRLGCTLLLSGLMIAATGPASEAGTLIKVSFSGNGFSGWFQYDQSEPKTSPGLFVFTGSTLNHEIQYQIGAGTPVLGTGKGCEPYKITTSGNGDKTFELIGTAPNGTTVTIVLPTSVALSQTSLPLTAAFPNPPLADSTFTLSGGQRSRGLSRHSLPPHPRQPVPLLRLSCYGRRVPRSRTMPGVCVPAAPGMLLDRAFYSTVSPCLLSLNG